MTYRYNRDTSTAAEQYHKAKGNVSPSTPNTIDKHIFLTPSVLSHKRGLRRPLESFLWRANPSHYEPSLGDSILVRNHLATSAEQVTNTFDDALRLHAIPTGERTALNERANTILESSLLNYLQTLSELPEFRDTETVQNAKILLHNLGVILGVRKLPTPQVAPSEENSLAFSWQTNKHQLGIYIYPGRKFDWLWRNPISKDYEGEEDVNLDIYVPSKLVSHLRDVFANG